MDRVDRAWGRLLEGFALGACLLVFALAQGPGGWTPTRLLLTGIVVAAGAGSIVSLLLALGDDTNLRGMVFWLLGDLSRAERWPWLLALLAVATAAGTLLGRHLNVLARGVTQAASVGLDVRRFQVLLFVLSSVLTGCAVSAASTMNKAVGSLRAFLKEVFPAVPLRRGCACGNALQEAAL